MRIDKRNLPLHALRAFEAVGRHLHMRKAADELCVSHSAVSQHIRKLEDLLGNPLFDRTNKGLILSPSGRKLWDQVNEAFDQLALATLNATPDSESVILRIACAYGLSNNWLCPRIENFLSDYPSFRVQINFIETFPKEIPKDDDLVICYGKPVLPENQLTRLSPQNIFPVCSQSYFEKAGRPTSLQEISQCTMIHADEGQEWKSWFETAGYETTNSFGDRNLFLTTGYSMVLDAVRRGFGVGLVGDRWIRQDIEDGTLLRLSDHSINTPQTYYIVRPEEKHRRSIGHSFENWVLDQWQSN